jgi:anti-sigma B factor antagonist
VSERHEPSFWLAERLRDILLAATTSPDDPWGLLSSSAGVRLVNSDSAGDAAGAGFVHWRPRRRVAMQLKLTKRTVDGILVIGCSGRIVFGEESSLLREEVKKALADGAKRVVLNLGEVTYIDSGGLGTLVALHTTAHNAGASIKLANLTKRVGDLLQVTKLLTVFEVHDSEYEALEAFRQAA